MIKLIRHYVFDGPVSYHARYDNGVYLGEIEREVDGYYVFWPDTNTAGFWAAHVLRELANKLDELNAGWDAQVRRDCSEPNKGRGIAPG